MKIAQNMNGKILKNSALKFRAEFFNFFSSIFWAKQRRHRAVARSENPGGHVVLGGDNVPPLVDIGLADLPKSGGGAQAPPAPHLRRACMKPTLSRGPRGPRQLMTPAFPCSSR